MKKLTVLLISMVLSFHLTWAQEDVEEYYDDEIYDHVDDDDKEDYDEVYSKLEGFLNQHPDHYHANYAMGYYLYTWGDGSCNTLEKAYGHFLKSAGNFNDQTFELGDYDDFPGLNEDLEAAEYKPERNSTDDEVLEISNMLWEKATASRIAFLECSLDKMEQSKDPGEISAYFTLIEDYIVQDFDDLLFLYKKDAQSYAAFMMKFGEVCKSKLDEPEVAIDVRDYLLYNRPIEDAEDITDFAELIDALNTLRDQNALDNAAETRLMWAYMSINDSIYQKATSEVLEHKKAQFKEYEERVLAYGQSYSLDEVEKLDEQVSTYMNENSPLNYLLVASYPNMLTILKHVNWDKTMLNTSIIDIINDDIKITEGNAEYLVFKYLSTYKRGKSLQDHYPLHEQLLKLIDTWYKASETIVVRAFNEEYAKAETSNLLSAYLGLEEKYGEKGLGEDYPALLEGAQKQQWKTIQDKIDARTEALLGELEAASDSASVIQVMDKTKTEIDGTFMEDVANLRLNHVILLADMKAIEGKPGGKAKEAGLTALLDKWKINHSMYDNFDNQKNRPGLVEQYYDDYAKNQKHVQSALADIKVKELEKMKTLEDYAEFTAFWEEYLTNSPLVKKSVAVTGYETYEVNGVTLNISPTDNWVEYTVDGTLYSAAIKHDPADLSDNENKKIQFIVKKNPMSYLTTEEVYKVDIDNGKEPKMTGWYRYGDYYYFVALYEKNIGGNFKPVIKVLKYDWSPKIDGEKTVNGKYISMVDNCYGGDCKTYYTFQVNGRELTFYTLLGPMGQGNQLDLKVEPSIPGNISTGKTYSVSYYPGTARFPDYENGGYTTKNIKIIKSIK